MCKKFMSLQAQLELVHNLLVHQAPMGFWGCMYESHPNQYFPLQMIANTYELNKNMPKIINVLHIQNMFITHTADHIHH